MYNTRRGGSYGSPATNVGQRRPAQQQNFVAGGQLKPNQHQQQIRPNMQQNQQQRLQQNQQQQQQQQQQKVPPKPAPQINMQKSAEKIINQEKAQEAKIVFKNEQAPPVPVAAPVPPKQEMEVEQELAAVLNQTADGKVDDSFTSAADETPVKQKPHWMQRKSKGVIKKDKNRRRNQQLKRLLQPKSALMVLNEISGSTSFEVTEMSDSHFAGPMTIHYKATVTIDGKVHEGFGKTKPMAKTAAAEAALKHLIVNRLTNREAAAPAPAATDDKTLVNMDTSDIGVTDNGSTEANGEDEKMEEEKEEDKDIPYCHLASFAIYKLYSSWDDSGKSFPQLLNRSGSATSLPLVSGGEAAKAGAGARAEMRPSKKMPDNPEVMNPVMLLNQMCPQAIYEEVCKTGVPPKITFTMKCTIDGKAFIGNGQNKKTARKEAAYQACREVLGVQYPEVVPPQQ